MAREVQQELLNELIDFSKIHTATCAISPDARQSYLFRKVFTIMEIHGDSEEIGQLRKTSPLITVLGSERIKLQLLENLPDFTLSVEQLPKEVGAERGELEIKIDEENTTWNGDQASPEQLELALGMALYLEDSGLPMPLTPDQKWRYEQRSGLSFRHRMYWINRSFGV